MFTYIVKPGDTLATIAAHHGVSVNAIMHANHMTGDLIHAGQVIMIPGGHHMHHMHHMHHPHHMHQPHHPHHGHVTYPHHTHHTHHDGMGHVQHMGRPPVQGFGYPGPGYPGPGYPGPGYPYHGGNVNLRLDRLEREVNNLEFRVRRLEGR